MNIDGWMASAVEGIQCQAPYCDSFPVCERNGRRLCAKHRNHFDNGVSGEPCPECESREWVLSPNAANHAVCAICDYVTYDESITEGSWDDYSDISEEQ